MLPPGRPPGCRRQAHADRSSVAGIHAHHLLVAQLDAVSAVLVIVTLARGFGGSLQAIADTVELHIAVDLVAAVVAGLGAAMFAGSAGCWPSRDEPVRRTGSCNRRHRPGPCADRAGAVDPRGGCQPDRVRPERRSAAEFGRQLGSGRMPDRRPGRLSRRLPWPGVQEDPASAPPPHRRAEYQPTPPLPVRLRQAVQGLPRRRRCRRHDRHPAVRRAGRRDRADRAARVRAVGQCAADAARTVRRRPVGDPGQRAARCRGRADPWRWFDPAGHAGADAQR